jgi:lipoprotein-releasing system ATP-binding protein
MNEPVLSCKNLQKRFDQGNLFVDVLQEVTLEVAQGERVAIMGSSGSGKSTLLHLLGGLESPSSGEITLDGHSLIGMNEKKLSELRNRVLGFIYQFHHLLGEFTLLENVAMPLLIGGTPVDIASSKANDILKRVGLGNRVEHKPGELSGGERQRAAIARALVTKPKCVLADEPTGNLDRRTADHVYGLMLELNQEFNVSFLVVTHDAALAKRMDTILQLTDGRLSS